MSNIEKKLYQYPGGLKLRKDGVWIQGGTPVTHRRIISYLNRHLEWFEPAESWGIPSDDWFIPVEIEDAPYLVEAIEFDRPDPQVVLSDESSRPFLAEDLRFGAGDVPYVSVEDKTARNGRADARFSRAAMQALIPLIDEAEGGYILRLPGGRVVKLGRS